MDQSQWINRSIYLSYCPNKRFSVGRLGRVGTSGWAIHVTTLCSNSLCTIDCFYDASLFYYYPIVVPYFLWKILKTNGEKYQRIEKRVIAQTVLKNNIQQYLFRYNQIQVYQLFVPPSHSITSIQFSEKRIILRKAII